MPDVACPTCGQSWGHRATFCGACGDRLPGGPARSTAPTHDPAPPRNATRGRWVVAGAVVLVALVAGAAAFVGGSGPSRDDGGDDEVAVPDDQDLQDVSGEQAATPPRVVCERDGATVDCVRWMRRLVSASPAPDHPWWVEVTPRRILARDAETLVTLSRSTGDVAWRHELDARRGHGHWSIGDEVVTMESGPATWALALSDGRERWSQDGTQLAYSNRRDRSGTIHTVQVDDGRSILASRRTDGTVRWRHTIEDVDEHMHRFPVEVTELGPMTFLTLDGREHELVTVALDGSDGSERWRRHDSRPLHASGDVAVVMEVDRDVQENGDSVSVSHSPSDLVGLDVTDGRERWRHDSAGGQPQFAIEEDILVTMGPDGITGFDTVTGEQRWHTSTHEDEHLLHPASWWGSPSQPGDGVLSFVPRESLVVARDPTTGRTLWRTQLDQLVGHVSQVEGAVIAQADEGTFIHLDPATGNVQGTVTVESDGQPMLAAGDVLVDQEGGWAVGIDLPPPQ